MQIDPNDMAVIEQALREGMNTGLDYQKVLRYREVLSRLQQIPTGSLAAQMESAESAQMDGFRYDADDSQ